MLTLFYIVDWSENCYNHGLLLIIVEPFDTYIPFPVSTLAATGGHGISLSQMLSPLTSCCRFVPVVVYGHSASTVLTYSFHALVEPVTNNK